MKTTAAKMFSLSFIFCFITCWLCAQDTSGNLDVTATVKPAPWYDHTWIWIVGSAIFILILVSLPVKKSKPTTTEM
ncbi:hypothetical protein [Parafilimonas terrae]|nr:hypothetical protein [Parafilimonas terrae]